MGCAWAEGGWAGVLPRALSYIFRFYIELDSIKTYTRVGITIFITCINVL
jgi:hypothetical protein